MSKLIKWFGANIASVLGIIQAIVKFIKEVLTAVINILLPVIPGDKFDAVVMKVRDLVNKIDEWIEKIKAKVLGQ